ncbi:MAG: hypothetical protein ACRCSV_00420 [Chlamydiales bacterium]
MKEILVVVSRIKSYIRQKGNGMSTSGDTMDALTDIVEKKCDAAIENAKRDRRKTVMKRDFL